MEDPVSSGDPGDDRGNEKQIGEEEFLPGGDQFLGRQGLVEHPENPSQDQSARSEKRAGQHERKHGL